MCSTLVEVDDAAAVVQPGVGFAHGIEGALYVDRHRAFEDLVAGLGDGHVGQDAGVVDEDVDAPEALFDLGKHALDIGGERDVGAHGQCVAAFAFDRRHHRPGLGFVAGVVDGDRETVARQAAGKGGADAARCAGDECDAGRWGGLLGVHGDLLVVDSEVILTDI
jgi:hypothetical protein